MKNLKPIKISDELPPLDEDVFWLIPFLKSKTKGEITYEKTIGYVDAETKLLYQTSNNKLNEIFSLSGDEIWYKEIK